MKSKALLTKSLLILGATGSVARAAFSVIKNNPKHFVVKSLVAHGNNLEYLATLALKYKPQQIALSDETKISDLMLEIEKKNKEQDNNNYNPIIKGGRKGVLEVVQCQHDMCISAISGIAGLEPTFAALSHCKMMAIANKESIICGGKILLEEAEKNSVQILPIDSEHSAIFQMLSDDNGRIYTNNVKKVILTASGGSLWEIDSAKFPKLNIETILKHPNWNMGAKISVDCATMLNKGFEFIEASYLFNLDPSKLDIIVHRQSIVHALVEYCNGSTLMYASDPNMELILNWAMFWPEKIDAKRSVNLCEIKNISFEAPNHSKFPLLKLALDTFLLGSNMIIALNASNEVAVSLFLERKINFLDIQQLIKDVLEHVKKSELIYKCLNNIDQILDFHQEIENISLKIYKDIYT